MKKLKFTEAQIVFAIKQFEAGMRVDEFSCQMGFFQATVYNWKKLDALCAMIHLNSSILNSNV
jgi:hypothetical protein